MSKHVQELLDIIKNVLNNDSGTVQVSDWDEVIKAAEKHNVQMFLYYFAKKYNATQALKMQKCVLSIMTQGANQEYSVKEMQSAFEDSGIYNLVIKGAVTRHHYSTPYLRSMGDIDLLYKPEQHTAFYNKMLELHYGNYQEGRKNDTYIREPHIVVEAHRELITAELPYAKYYADIWERAVPYENKRYTYRMTVEDEFIFNILHLVGHFLEGGAGIRFIIDIYVYNHIEMNREYLCIELEKLHVWQFYQNISDLAEYWFGEKEEISETVKKLGEYIATNGVFGNRENAGALAVKDGRLAYLLRASFPKYESMVSMYPWLRDKKYLLPYAWIRRAVSALTKRKGNVDSVFSHFHNGDVEKGVLLYEFYKECGLE